MAMRLGERNSLVVNSDPPKKKTSESLKTYSSLDVEYVFTDFVIILIQKNKKNKKKLLT